MTVSKAFFLEQTNVTTKTTTTFNSPGVYQPPYGKTVYLLQGQGQPGNASSGGNYAGTNPATGGNYAGTNPGSGGNYAGTNPSTGGNYAGTNPSTGGNYAGTNPPTGGNYAGTNPTTYTIYQIANYDGYDAGTNAVGTGYGPLPSPFSSGGTYFSYANSAPNPGNVYYNPTVPGNAYYNPTVPGNPYYNPTVPGNPYYNPYYPGNPYYNPYYPGNAYYNPYYPGNTGPTNNVLGVTLPGGPADSSAPVVGYTPVAISFTNAGTPVSVPTGGYIKIQNT